MDTKHSSGILGSLAGVVDTLRDNAMDYVKLGAGAAGGILVTDFALSRLLVKDGKPLVPEKWSPLAIAVAGVLGGELAKKYLDKDVGMGVVAGTVGLAVSAMVGKFTAPAVSATTAAADASESAGQTAQATAGFGFGRAFAPSVGSFAGAFAGLGRMLPEGRELLYGVGTPNMGAASMFSGATVSIEDDSGAMAGANVSFEDDGSSGFAGILN